MLLNSPFFSDLKEIHPKFIDSPSPKSSNQKNPFPIIPSENSLILVDITSKEDFCFIDKKYQYSNDIFVEFKHIGTGGYGQVFKVEIISKDCIEKYALKIVELEENEIKEAQREVQCLSKINSKYVVKFFHSWVLPSQITNDIHNLFIQMKYVEGISLKTYLDSRSEINYNESIIILKQLIFSLKEIHLSNVVHRDFTPSNILIQNNLEIIIIDFGISSYHRNSSLDLRDLPPRPSSLIETSLEKILPILENDRCSIDEIGTPAYASPQQLMGKKSARKDDIYSLGIITLELFIKFKTFMEKALIFNQYKKQNLLPIEIEQKYPLICDLIKKMTKSDFYHRPSALDLLKEQIFQ